MLAGDEFKRLRISRGLSLKDIAYYVDKSKAFISMYENFKVVPSDDTYAKMLEAVYKQRKK